jgi:hypothetical protein
MHYVDCDGEMEEAATSVSRKRLMMKNPNFRPYKRYISIKRKVLRHFSFDTAISDRVGKRAPAY